MSTPTTQDGAFVHEPRPPVRPSRDPASGYRLYRSDGDVVITDRDATFEINVQGNPTYGHANLNMRNTLDQWSGASVSVALRPDALRELARCLIDAAADIEQRAVAPIASANTTTKELA